MLTNKIIRTFGRLHRPKVSQFKNIQEIVRDNSDQITYLENYNKKIYQHNKNYTISKQLAEQYGLSQQASQQMSQGTTVYQIAHDALTHKGYWIKQKLNTIGSVQIDDIANDVNIPYSTDKRYLKFHESINKDVPKLKDYPINKSTAYIFNLPHQITQKQIMLELGFRFVKSVTIKYCMLGLPAYAVAQFLSQNSLTDKIMTQQLQIMLNDRQCPVITHIDRPKLLLQNRQIAIHNISPECTPAKLLQQFSKYGRVIDLNYPQKIYREPSIQQIKQKFKDSKYPVNIRYHRLNGTIQQEFYPQFRPSMEQMTQKQKNQEQNQWRLNYSEIIDIHEGQQGKIKVRGKGYCIVTYACVQQAQNCYFRQRLQKKCQLVMGRQQFEFDEQRRKQLLRHVDYQFIERKKQAGQNNIPDKLDDELFQNFYLDMTIQTTAQKFYGNSRYHLENQTPQMMKFVNYERYKDKLIDLQRSIGAKYNQNNSQTSIYGKSFSQLAQQQLYKHKLPKQATNQRYQIDIGKYQIDQDKIDQIQNLKQYKNIQNKQNNIQAKVGALKISEGQDIQYDDQTDVQDQLDALDDRKVAEKGQGPLQQEGDLIVDRHGIPRISSQKPINIKLDQRVNYKFYDQIFAQPQVHQQQQQGQQGVEQDQDDNYDGKRHFSTFSSSSYFSQNYRPKTLQQKVQSHISYNRYIRNIINEYIGVFPTDKLEQQFYRKKPNYTNPQNLRFRDGTPFLNDSYSQIKRIMQFSTNPGQQCQNILNQYMKQNQHVKSLNLNVEEIFLKDLKNNVASTMMLLSEMGIIKEQFVADHEDPVQFVKQLNKNQAQFGEQYRLIIDEETNQKSIAKIAKLDHLYPIQLNKQINNILNFKQKENQLTQEQFEVLEKHYGSLVDGQQYPQQVQKAFNLKAGEKFSSQQLFETIRNDFEKYSQTDIRNKDLQKLMNLPNYTQQQIGQDIARQNLIKKEKSKFEPVNASDYSRDASNIYVRDKNGKFRVSKFRQM